MVHLWPEMIVARHRLRLIVILVGSLTGCTPDSPATIATDENARKSAATAVIPQLAESSHHTSPLPEEAPGEMPAEIPEEADEISVPEPSPSEPVTAAMKIRSQSAVPGENVELLVFVRIARTHYLHADEADSTFAAVAMQDALPEGVEPLGDWIYPEPVKGPGKSRVYRDSVLIRRSVRILPETPARTLLFAGELRYQACTEELCWPPAKLELSTPLVIRSPSR